MKKKPQMIMGLPLVTRGKAKRSMIKSVNGLSET